MSMIQSLIKGDKQTLLLVTGGLDGWFNRINDASLLNFADGASWRQLSIMKYSYCHSTCGYSCGVVCITDPSCQVVHGDFKVLPMCSSITDW